jgi:hypothetical protein
MQQKRHSTNFSWLGKTFVGFKIVVILGLLCLKIQFMLNTSTTYLVKTTKIIKRKTSFWFEDKIHIKSG